MLKNRFLTVIDVPTWQAVSSFSNTSPACTTILYPTSCSFVFDTISTFAIAGAA